MVTIALTYRDRAIDTLQNCLNSLANQTVKEFNVVVVDYGSQESYAKSLAALIKGYDFASLIRCETQGQLWCKSRAVNLVLKQCTTPSFFVGDVDMIFHPEFMAYITTVDLSATSVYFQVGFLNEGEADSKKAFDQHKIAFKSSDGATGMTLFSTKTLKAIHGYDEFYNGWGSEDTDVHIRLRNAGHRVNFYDTKILMLHQWHPKTYRTASSKAPFHSHLEQINSAYLKFTDATQKIKTNKHHDWGLYNAEDYKALNSVTSDYTITNSEAQVKAFISNVLLGETDKVIQLTIVNDPSAKEVKRFVKRVMDKKVIKLLSMQEVNDHLIETIITHLSNSPYRFEFDTKANRINLIIKL